MIGAPGIGNYTCTDGLNFKLGCSAIFPHIFLYFKMILMSTNVARKIFYNHGHNSLRLFDVWPNFPSIKSETKRDYTRVTS